MTAPIPFIDLQGRSAAPRRAADRAIHAAVEGGQWILGPQVAELEQRLAAFAGVKHCVTCANGTDALLLVLRAWNIGRAMRSSCRPSPSPHPPRSSPWPAAAPVFVDVSEDTHTTMDPASLEAAIALVRRQGNLKARAVMPVDLFGQPADYRTLEPIVRRAGLKMLCDTAQGFGGRLDGRVTGSIGDAAATSFLPGQALGLLRRRGRGPSPTTTA